MTFHPHPEVMQPILVSYNTNFFYHPSTYSNSLEASCFLAKWLLLHKKQLLADLCGLLGSYSPSLMTLKYSSPCLHLLAMDMIELSQLFLKLFNLLFLFCNYPNISCINPDILQRWCNVLVCRHSWCWCWWRRGYCVGITLFFMSSHHCWWTMQIQRDSGCVDLKKMKSCVTCLWLTQSFWTNVQMACLNLKWKSVIFPAATSEIQRNSICIFFGCFKTKKIVCILVISVMSNIFECQKSWYSRPYFSAMTFQNTEGFNVYMIFLSFESFQISSNVRNPNSPVLACLWIPMLTLHISSQNLRLY